MAESRDRFLGCRANRVAKRDRDWLKSGEEWNLDLLLKIDWSELRDADVAAEGVPLVKYLATFFFLRSFCCYCLANAVHSSPTAALLSPGQPKQE